ncbi:pyridoxine 5'-phosphate synthase [bacterium]
MPKLGVNIDHVATVRQARLGINPDPLQSALLAEKGGAQGITIHLREDRRHIQDKDVINIKENIKTKLNLEMAVSDEIINIAVKVKPYDVCIVPEKRQELTTEGGLDIISNFEKVKNAVKRLKDAGICVSIFLDPLEKQIITAKEIGADAVELHTGCYANAENKQEADKKLDILKHVSKIVLEKGLILNAGHGLDYENVKPVAEIEGMNELNIGHSIIARSIFTGIEHAVREMKEKL